MNRIHLRVTMFLLFCAATVYSQTPCNRIVPITVVVQDGSIVKHLPAETLSTATKKIVLQHDFTADDSKRRVLIVLDGSSDLSKDVVEAEKLIAHTIVESARPEDRFALISGNAVPVRANFDGGNTAVLAAIDSFTKGGSGGKKAGLLDSIHEGLSWFGTPEFGDSVLLMASETGSRGGESRIVTGSGKVSDARTFSAVESKIDPRELQIELILHGVRVFSESLGGLDVGTSAALRAAPGAAVQVNGNDDALRGQTQFAKNYDATSGSPDVISFNSGGFTFVHPEMGQGWTSFKLNEASRKSLTDEAMKLYLSIALIYRVSLQYSEPKQMKVNLDLRPQITNRLPSALVLHLRALPACTSK
jgi:hypothetical protein